MRNWSADGRAPTEATEKPIGPSRGRYGINARFVASSALQGTRGALNLPIGFRFGIAASSALSIGIQIELPMWLEFGPFGGFNLPILTGGGVEYFVTSNLALYLKARVGPTIRTDRPTEVAFDASLGVGYHFK